MTVAWPAFCKKISAHLFAFVQSVEPTFYLSFCAGWVLLGGVVNATLCAQATAYASAPSAVSSTASLGDTRQSKEFAQSPLSFEPHQGQDKSDGERSNTRYIAYGHGYLLRLEPARASLQFQTCSEPKRACDANHSTLGLKFVGANEDSAITGSVDLPGKHSYFPTGDRKSWATAVSTYARVNYREVYPGIGLSFYGNSGQLEYDFILDPNGDPKKIQMALEGADHVQLEKNGDVSITMNGSTFRLLKPLAYQTVGDLRVPVQVSYALHNADTSGGMPPTLTFSLGAYERQRPLVIDPVLIYGTYLPSTAGYSYSPYYFANTYVRAMTADSKGDTYLAASVGGSNGSYSIFKYDPSGNLLLNVSLGTANVSTSPQSIAVDSTGNIFVAGSTSVGIPVTSNAFQKTAASGTNQSGFLTVIKADGSSLLYSTYFGGSGQAIILGMAIGPKGKAFVTGSGSGSFPTTSGAYQASSGNFNTSGFAAEFDTSLSGSASLVWSTMLTGNASSQSQSTGTAIAVDSKGDAYVASNASSDFPVTSGGYAYSGIDTNGAYVTELNPTGTALIYSAFLGPGGPTGIAVDGAGSAYVIGGVNAADFPVTSGAYQTTSPSGFAAKLSSDGSQLLYSTFLGSPDTFTTQGVLPTTIALLPGCASGCNAYIAGLTSSADFPMVNPVQAQQFFPETTPVSPYGGSQSGFLVNLAADGKSVAYSTYLGALGSPTQSYGTTPAVGIDSSGNVYFASNIYGPDAPATLPSVIYPGYGFLAKVGPSNAGALVAAPNTVAFLNTPTQSVTLRNVGSAAVQLQRPFVFSSSEFSETDACPSVMSGGSACTLELSFAPTATGPRSGSLTVSSNSTNSPATIALSVPTDYTNVSISGLALTYSDQVLNTTSNSQTLTVTNLGTQAEPVTILTPSEPDYLVSSTCPAQLAGGASCSISVKFQPTQIGLRSAYLNIGIPGVYTQIGNSYISGYYQVTLTGTGVLSTSGTGALTLSESSINFGSIVKGTSASGQSFTVFNSGNTPVTVNSITASTAANMGQPGDFSVVSSPNNNYGPNICGALSPQTGRISDYSTPFSLAPQASCVIYVGFQPSIAGQETGSVSITDSATGSPHTVALSGIGLYASQPLVISPPTMTFPPQPVDDPSAPQTFYVYNNGEDQVVIDRAVTTGDFNIVDNGYSNCEGATVGSCSLAIAFTPTATGARTGTLTFFDSLSGTPLVFNLSGTGIQATGTLILGQSSLSFPAQAKGSTSASQEVVVTNPGNSPITINTVTASGDFAVVPSFSTSAACGGVLAPGTTCVISVTFSPTQSSGSETGTLSIRSTAGTTTVNLSGSAIAAAAAVQITAAAVNFGNVKVGTTTAGPSNEVVIYVNNTGNAPVTFTNPPVITGTSPTPSGDFSIYQYGIYCQGNNYITLQSIPSPVPMPPGANCSLTLVFNPTLQAPESATLTFVDSAGTQTITLTGTGTAQQPVAVSQPATTSFGVQPIGSNSTNNGNGLVGLYNNGTTPVTIASVAVTAGSSDFAIENNGPQCANVVVQPGSNCSVYILFTPSVAGYRTGSVTFKDSGGNSYVTQLAGYAVAAVKGAIMTPQAAVLPDQAVGTSGTVFANFALSNTGNLPFTVGTVTATNVSLNYSSANTDFVDTAYVCSGSSVNPGTSCPISIVFRPQSLGKKTGSVTIPVTYADSTQATFTATVSGTGVATTASANLYPQTYFFSTPQVVSATNTSYQNQVYFYLANTGTSPLTVGSISGQNITTTPGSGGDFVYPTGAYSSCAGETVPPGGTCNVTINFIPLSVGTKTGSINLPVTYANGSTATFTATFSGTAVAPTRILQVTPSSATFNVEVVGTTDLNNESTITFSNIGNSPVTFGSAATSNANFTIVSNNCTQSVYAPGSCSITVAFTPLATTSPGIVTGVLSVVDNATGNPHTVPLSGTAISVAQQLGLSQTSVSFGSYAVGTTSPQQVVYLVDLGSSNPSQATLPSRVQINSIKLGGANASDFVEADNCGGALGFTISGRSSCEIAVSFAPAISSLGVRTASVTITPAQGSPLVIQLIGNGAATTTGPTALQFVPVAPCRVVDTRNPTGQFGGPQMAAKTSREFDIPQSDCGIPSNALAYSLNVTAVPSVSLGYLAIWPSGEPQPLVSTLNSFDGRVKANAVIIPAGTNGGVNLYVTNPANVILDIDGYFVPAGTTSASLAFYPLTPCRVADTRNATGGLGGPSMAGGSSRAFPVLSSNCKIPSTAKAYSFNVTAVPHTPLGYLSIWPTGQTQPVVSTLNSLTGVVTANAAIVEAGTSGEVSVFVQNDADVILDVNGYFAPPGAGGLSLYPVTPCRVIDTRNGIGPVSGVLSVNVTGSPCGPPSTAKAYVLNATVVPSGILGYLTLWPAGETQPVVSTLNAVDGAITSNMAIVPTANGSIDAFPEEPTDLFLDLSSYFAP